MKKLNIFQLIKLSFCPFKNATWKKKMSCFYKKIQGIQIRFNVCASEISLKHPHDLKPAPFIINYKTKIQVIKNQIIS